MGRHEGQGSDGSAGIRAYLASGLSGNGISVKCGVKCAQSGIIIRAVAEARDIRG